MTATSSPALVSHWAAGTWPPGQRRLHWYLLPGRLDETADAAIRTAFARPGFDLVPQSWLHCTVVALVPSLGTIDEGQLAAMVAAVRDAAPALAPVTASATAKAYHSAGVWELQPVDAFMPVFDAVVDACTGLLRTDPAGGYRPHVTFAYSSADHGDADVQELLAAQQSSELCRFDTLYLLDVRQADGCYQWDIVEIVELGGDPGLAPGER